MSFGSGWSTIRLLIRAYAIFKSCAIMLTSDSINSLKPHITFKNLHSIIPSTATQEASVASKTGKCRPRACANVTRDPIPSPSHVSVRIPPRFSQPPPSFAPACPISAPWQCYRQTPFWRYRDAEWKGQKKVSTCELARIFKWAHFIGFDSRSDLT